MVLIGHMCIGPTMHHAGSWRHPDSDVHEVLDPVRYERLARLYERGLFDGLFMVDYQTISDLKPGSASGVVERGGQITMLDPLQMLAVMARVTRHVGLAATLSTTYNHPFAIARKFATLDHISHGRAGWNIVTSAMPGEAHNLGLDELPTPEKRYDHGDEVMEACMELWNSWDADALKIDRERGLFADPAKVHYVEYRGPTVKTAGALTAPRSPQGQPLFMQAGSSGRGREFAARWAEAIFTTQAGKASMQAFYGDIKQRMVAFGRRPETCAVLPAIATIVGESDAEARERADYIDSFTTPAMGIGLVELILGGGVAGIPLDTPIAKVPVGPKGPTAVGSYDKLLDLRKDGRPVTLGEAAVRMATTWGLPRFVGKARDVADQMQDAFESGCCDGFILAQPLSPGDLERFVDLVVPELQRRGLYRTGYVGKTFRGNVMKALSSENDDS
jgi:FMN-dependent oxidoreductase (nitrilotriacetate monooxygenase family)